MIFIYPRQRWAEALAVVAVLPLLALGIYLLSFNSAQLELYNQAVQSKQTEAGQKDLPAQTKLLEASLAAHEQAEQRNRVRRLVFGEPALDIAARSYFHKAIVLVQTPNKGKEAFEATRLSLTLNPGNMYSGLTPDEMALWKNDSDQARRLLEKLIRSGQDGGRGKANQPGRPGEQGQEPGDRRDPGKEPKPGSGRQPNNIL